MGKPKSFMNDEIIEYMRAHSRPFVTASELAEAMSVNNSAIHKRLSEIDRIKSKKVGARAKVFWLPCRENDILSN